MPSAHFEKIGVKVEGEFRQLNANVLQIENEFYSPIRAKRVTLAGEKPSQALARAGVEYIEVRALDVNPFSPVGIDADQVRFLDLFLLHCLLTPSPKSDATDEAAIGANLSKVITRGREPGLTLNRGGEQVTLQAWLESLFGELSTLAKLLDGEGQAYQDSLAHWLEAVRDPAKTLSGRVMSALLAEGIDHSQWVKSLAKDYYHALRDYPLTPEVEAAYEAAAEQSLAAQAKLEAESVQDFEQYLADYFAEAPAPVDQVV